MRITKLICCAMFIASGLTASETPAAERDGQHDFDFEFGSWKVHLRRLAHPLTGSQEWLEYDGTIVARPVWGGKANMDEVELQGPAGHLEGMTVRTYNTQSHEWSIYWANQATGVMAFPATVGKWKDGRGEFFDQEDYNGKKILARFVWTIPSPDAPHFEQSFSTDGGKTWETNWITTFERVRQ